jgi:hypothetical protein
MDQLQNYPEEVLYLLHKQTKKTVTLMTQISQPKKFRMQKLRKSRLNQDKKLPKTS